MKERGGGSRGRVRRGTQRKSEEEEAKEERARGKQRKSAVGGAKEEIENASKVDVKDELEEAQRHR